MLSQDADIRELIREWNISRNLQNVTPTPRIRQMSQSSLAVRSEWPESENGPIMSTDAWIDSIDRKRPNRNISRSSSCDPIVQPGLKPSSGDELRGKQRLSLPALTPPSSMERLRSSSNGTAASSAHRRALQFIHPTQRDPSPGSASPNEAPPHAAAGILTRRSRPSGGAAAAGSPAPLDPPAHAPTSLTGRLLGTLSRPATIRRAVAGRLPQAGLCFIWNRGRRPADFKEPERTVSEAARRAEAAHAR
jgi:hypothetical protein